VGIDANRPHHGPAARKGLFKSPRQSTLPRENRQGDNWHPGDAPSQVFEWAVEALAKAGTFSIVGVYGETVNTFPIGKSMEKNLTLKMGNCNHRKYIPKLLELVRTGAVEQTEILTQVEPISDVIEAYQQFDKRTPGWVKVMLEPSADRQAA
jgi:threonine dehydrogenase-like Zn-dependent dehydrogenase